MSTPATDMNNYRNTDKNLQSPLMKGQPVGSGLHWSDTDRMAFVQAIVVARIGALTDFNVLTDSTSPLSIEKITESAFACANKYSETFNRLDSPAGAQ